MTVQNTTTRADYTANGSTTTFSVPFYFLDSSHLKVLLTSTANVVTTLALGTDYSVSGTGVPAGGSITTVATPASGVKVSILRNIPYTQLTHYVANDPFPSASHEAALDLLTMEAQQLSEVASRAITLPANSSGVSTALPSPVANQILAFNSAANGLALVDPTTLATVAAYGNAKADIFTGNGSQTNFTLSANPGTLYNINVWVHGVCQTPGTDFTWASGTTLTFTTAPANGLTILVRYMQALSTIPNVEPALGNPASNGYVLSSTTAGVRSWIAASGGGSVSSVGLSMPSMFTVTNSPVTGSGTLTATLASQTANLVLASPNGSSGTPTFRSLALADMTGIVPYDISGFISGKPANGANVLVIPITRSISVPATTHRGQALTAATASTVLTFKKNGTSFGTATWAASGTVPTWSITATSFVAGDYITVSNQATADSTLADIGFTLMATV